MGYILAFVVGLLFVPLCRMGYRFATISREPRLDILSKERREMMIREDM